MHRRRYRAGSDSKKYYNWLERANEDIISAGVLLKNDNCYNAAAFHCQQTIEKALKAYILFKSDQLVDGHNLTWLCKRAMRHHERFSVWLTESAALNRCYIETRYPADIPTEITYKDIRKYYHTAREMFIFICAEVDKACAEHDHHPAQREEEEETD
jgi:HEPN domain-containing protein